MKTLLPAILLTSLIPCSALAATAPLAPQTVIKIPDGEHGIGFDDIGYAAPLNRITIPAGATGNLVLIDPETGALTTIPGVTPAHAAGQGHDEGTSSTMYADGYHLASDQDLMEEVSINPRTHAIVGRTRLESGPDDVSYVARTHEIWVTEPGKEQILVFKLSITDKPVLTPETVIHIAGGPESLEIDNQRNRAYSNLWKDKTVEMELTTHKVLAEWPNTCKGSNGIAQDEEHDYVFVACSEGKVVTLAPTKQGKILTSASAGAGIDIISYSPRLHHLYVPGARAATLTIFDVSASGALKSLAVYKTAEHAHCVTDDNNGHVYVCAPRAGEILEVNDR